MRNGAKRGYIYVLSNSSMPSLLKIGHSANGGAKRAKELETTGVPMPFDVEFEVYSNSCNLIEDQVHSRLDKYRISNNREFFKVDLTVVVLTILSELAHEMDFSLQHYDFMISDDDLSIISNKLSYKKPDDPSIPQIARALKLYLLDNPNIVIKALEFANIKLAERKKGLRVVGGAS